MNTLPLRIIHINRSSSVIDRGLIKTACSALSMKSGEYALLLFYCQQSSGFRPSISLITKRTGLGKRAILRNRQLLVEDGLVAVWRNCIFVDWSRIALFATLDRSMVPKQRSRRTVAPVVVRRNARRFTDRFLSSCYSMPLNSLCGILSSMTDEDFNEWKSGMNRIGTRGA